MTPTPIDEVQEEAQSRVSIDELEDSILDIISEEEGMAWTNAELAEELGTDRQHVSRVTRKLRENDELNALRPGKAFYYFVGEADFDSEPSTTSEEPISSSPAGS